jgi:alanyl-tRNA synthetase
LKEILDEEERSFAKTLDRGEKLFAEYLQKSQKSKSLIMSGADVWRLYDTYGFPVDLTRLMAAENGMSINEAEFEREQNESKERSKKTKSKGDGVEIKLDVHALGHIEKEGKILPTNDSFKYESDDITALVKGLYVDGNFVTSANTDSGHFGIILDKTCFYAEQGGQMNDTGNIGIDGVFDFAVEDVQIFGGYVLHIGYLKYGAISLGNEIVCSFDEVCPIILFTFKPSLSF